VGGTQVLIGELAQKPRSGFMPGNNICDETLGPGPAPPSCARGRWTALDFLTRSLDFARQYITAHDATFTGPVPAYGLALHPYQYSNAPNAAGPKDWIGIGRLKSVTDKLTSLCGGLDANHKCKGQMGSPDGGPSRLYLTEFGYFNRPTPNGNTKVMRTEGTRRKWFRGWIHKGTHKKGALDQAVAANAAMMNIYTLVETTPAASAGAEDYGLIGDPLTYTDSQGNAPADGDIVGERNYGKPNPHSKYVPPPNAHITRQAYCGIRSWAIAAKYFDPSNSAFQNSCQIK
jgi:hypothetical protein